MLKKSLDYIYKLFVYGGINKDEYDKVRHTIRKNNQYLWRIISFFIFVMALVSLFSAIGVEELKVNQVVYIIFSVITFLIFIAIFFINPKYEKISTILIYTALVVSLALGITISNLGTNNWPGVTFFVIIVALPMLIVARPWITSLIVIISSIVYIVLIMNFKVGKALNVDIYNAIVFMFISLFGLSFTSATRIKGFLAQVKLDELSKYDGLTGLENELSYVILQEQITKSIAAHIQDNFAVAMFDVNGVKPTNDTYGHTYGCALIVEAGHYINSLFKKSRCFHVGGDEYIVVLLNEDYENQDQLLKEFSEKMDNYFITVDDVELRLSVACGISNYTKGKDKNFSDVMKRADKEMYKNKKMMKEHHQIASRKEE